MRPPSDQQVNGVSVAEAVGARVAVGVGVRDGFGVLLGGSVLMGIGMSEGRTVYVGVSDGDTSSTVLKYPPLPPAVTPVEQALKTIPKKTRMI